MPESPRDEILRLRAERARLLGYPSHAHWRLEDTMARTPERALALMESVWPAAVARAHGTCMRPARRAEERPTVHRGVLQCVPRV